MNGNTQPYRKWLQKILYNESNLVELLIKTNYL